MDKSPNVLKVFTPSVVRFLIVAFVPAWLLFSVPLLFKGGESLGLTRLITWSLAMWMPGLGAVLATRWTENRKLSSLKLGTLGKRGAYLWAWALPILLVAGAAALTWALGWGRYELGFSQLQEGFRGALPPSQLSLAGIVWLQIVAAVLIAPFINTLFALGEELGWRGFLLPRLLPLGQTKAMLLTGLIWGVWHIPAVLQGLNYPGSPAAGSFMMIAFTITFGIFLSWLYFKSRSPWAPAFAHGTTNAVAGLSLLFIIPRSPLWGGTLASAAGLLVTLVFVLILYAVGELPVLT